jgi:hypothetical protein
MRVGSEAVPIRTPAGQAELSTRERRLSQRHRTLLHLIDGRRGEAEIRRMGIQAGVPDSCFGELLAMHLIDVRRSPAAPATATALVHHEASHQHVALPIGVDWREGVVSDSELPALRTVPPSSGFRDSGSGSPAPSSWFMTDPIDDRGGDDALERAREILLRTVRAEAPVAGSLTSLRLRRARSRDELQTLIPEVEARVGKPPRTLSATLAIQQVRTLLAGPRQLAWASR